jgi:hypothetical protein
MNSAEYTNQINDLFERWKKSKGYTDDNFTVDGVAPQNWDKWNESKPKILFLLKENFTTDFEPQYGVELRENGGRDQFSWNVARWRYVIKELFDNPRADIIYDKFNPALPVWVDDVALVEVKKLNEGASTSDNSDIKKYAKEDREFLQEQIEILNPDVIICCYTGDSYDQFRTPNEEYVELFRKSNCPCYKDGNRLCIDFYHPSSFTPFNSIELFDILKEMIVEGDVFSQFEWGN